MFKQLNKPKTSRSLTATLALAFLALSVAILLIVSGFETYLNFQAQQTIVAGQQHLIAQDAANTVASFIQEKFSVLETAAKFANPVVAPQKEQQRDLEVLLGTEPAFHFLVLLDSQEQELVKVSRLSQAALENFKVRAKNTLFTQVKQGNRYISPVYVDEATSEPMVLMAVPVTNAFGDFQGVLLAEVNLKFMWDLVDNLEIGQTGLAYVVDKQGNLIAFGDIARVLKGENVAQLTEVGEFISNPGSIDETGASMSQGIEGTTVVGTYVPLGTPDWAVVTELPVSEAYREIIQGTLISVGAILVMAILAGLIGVYVARRLAVPLLNLTDTATRIAQGNLNLKATIEGPIESVRLAEAFNSMTTQLRELVGSLEQRVADRTHRLEIVATLGEQLNAILDPNDLPCKVVNQVKNNFGYYHTLIYLLDGSRENLMLAADSGQAGEEMIDGDYRIPLNTSPSLVAQAARAKEVITADNIQADENWLPNLQLPQTQAEMAVPIMHKGEVIGMLDVQQDRVGGLDEDDANLLRSVANQVAVALSNAHLFTETTQRATALEALSEVSQRLSAVLDPQELIKEVVQQIGAAFSYYYTQIYLFDQAQENLVFAGGTGKVGQLLLERQHSLPKGQGLIGQAAEQNAINLAQDVKRNIGAEIITQANLKEVYQREVDPVVEAKWYAQHIAGHFDHIKKSQLNEEPATGEAKLKLGYVLHLPPKPFIAVIQRGIEAAARDLQVDVEVVAPPRDYEHRPLFEQMIEQGKDGLVVIPSGPDWVEQIQAALTTGVPVVTANRDLANSPALTHVGQDNFQAGMILARELVKQLQAAGKDEGIILAINEITERFAGVRYGLRDTNYILIELPAFQYEKRQKPYWEQAIDRHPNLIAAVGLTALETPILAEIKCNTGGEWFIVGFDLNLATLEAIRDGTVQFTIGQHPYLQGYLPILALVEHLRWGKSLQGWMTDGWLPDPLLPETRAEIAVPIVLGGQVLGVLDVQHNVTNSLTPENASLLRSVADQVAVALSNARLFAETVQAKEEAEQAKEEAEQAKQEIEAANQALEVQVWQTTGQAQLNDNMRGEQDVRSLASRIIRHLCRYLDAQVGTLYLADGNSLTLMGSYAFAGNNGTTSFTFGQGLVGQVALEKQPLTLTTVPDDYLTISSGLGQTPPKTITLFPILYEERVMGVIELGTLSDFSQPQLNFIGTALDSIAIAFNTAQVRARIDELLEETQRQAEDLQTQGEELRQANEELAAQTKSLQVSETELKKQQAELEATNAQLEEQTAALEESSRILREKQAILDRQNQQLRSTQQALEQKAEELARASNYKSEFLANMSHELRTPLNSLLILARMLADNQEGNLTQEQVESAQIIYSGGQDLLNLINDILDLAKVESGKMVFNYEPMSLTDLKAAVELQFAHLAKEKGLDFAITIADDLPITIQTDPQRLKQVVKNLLSNAFKFTDQGSVSLNIYRPTPEIDLSRSNLDPSKAVAISVVDTGIGMTPEQQQLIFEAFQQADGSTSRKYGGTGLGLSISRELASKLGGQIGLESAPGQGSAFTLYLPVKREAPKEPESRGAEEYPGGHRQKSQGADERGSISPTPPPPSSPALQPAPQLPDDRDTLTEDDKLLVVIEDDPNFAKVVYNYAHTQAFKCLLAADGATGLELINTHRPEAVILDLNLPAISGWEVLAQLKHNPDTRHIPVHIISADDEILDAYRKGAMGYLTKPVSQEELKKSFQNIESLIAKDIKSLLLVEDDANSRRAIKKLLAGSDLRISEADHGQQALNLLQAEHFDCVILDLGLPDMSGFDVLNQLHTSNGSAAKCPVIVYTGQDLTPQENLELMQVADSVILKGDKSPERLLDETALFLHRVVAEMPKDKQQTIKQLYNKIGLLQGKKILIVDDDMRNAFALSKLLSDKGVIVKLAQNGQKALDLLAEEPDIDLILMDIMMPVLDGFETTQRIRQQPQFNSLPILALTAKAMTGDREKCLAAGVNDYLPKPVDIDRLFSMLQVWLY